jgi:phosphoribosyl 1,2-cyclic phosphate phosphodiesterase
MEVIFLGTGTSHGVPMLRCDCAVCRSPDVHDHRTRASIHVVMDGLPIQVDAAPEFRLQCLRERITEIAIFCLTHGHADHLLGMDDLRRFCDDRTEGLPVYCSEEGAARVRVIYPYALAPADAPRDGYARFALRTMPARLELPQGSIESTPLPHGRVDTLGLVFTEKSSGRRFAYYTDASKVPPAAEALARGADLLVLDGLRPQPHPTHMSIAEAVAAAARIGARQTLLTHIAHAASHAQITAMLPAGIAPAHDGLRVRL